MHDASGALSGGPSERKNVQQMADRLCQLSDPVPWAAGALGSSGHKSLQRFVSGRGLDDGPMWNELTRVARNRFGRRNSCIVVDDIALPKKGDESVGAALQSVGPHGELARCQATISFLLASGTVAMPVAWRLILPEEWTSDPERCVRAGVPVPASGRGDWKCYGDKERIVLDELRRLRNAGVPFVSVMIGADYIASPRFCEALADLKASWVVPVQADQKVFPVGAQDASANSGTRYPLRGRDPCAACAIPKPESWRRVGNDRIAQDPPSFALERVRIGAGAPWPDREDLLAEEMCLLVGRLASGERCYFLTNLKPKRQRIAGAAAVRAHWARGRASQCMEQFGRDHFEGRSWTGLHRHLLLVAVSYA